MIYPVVRELAADPACPVPVAVACRVLGVSASGYYGWLARPPSARQLSDLQLVEVIREIHQGSRGTYGAPRVHAELRLGRSVRVGRKRVERLMRAEGLCGITRRRRAGCTRRNPGAAPPADDLVNRRFTVTEPDRLWCSDITEHPTGEGKLYTCPGHCHGRIAARRGRVIGWSTARPGASGSRLPGPAVAWGRPSRLGAARGGKRRRDGRGVWALGERVDRFSRDLWQHLGVVGIGRFGQRGATRIGRTFDTARRRGFLIQLTREMAEQDLFGLVQIAARGEVYTACTMATPQKCTRAATRPAPAAPIDGVIPQQHVQRSARPPLHRAKTTASH